MNVSSKEESLITEIRLLSPSQYQTFLTCFFPAFPRAVSPKRRLDRIIRLSDTLRSDDKHLEVGERRRA
jgi:hypothetical protein